MTCTGFSKIQLQIHFSKKPSFHFRHDIEIVITAASPDTVSTHLMFHVPWHIHPYEPNLFSTKSIRFRLSHSFLFTDRTWCGPMGDNSLGHSDSFSLHRLLHLPKVLQRKTATASWCRKRQTSASANRGQINTIQSRALQMYNFSTKKLNKTESFHTFICKSTSSRSS